MRSLPFGTGVAQEEEEELLLGNFLGRQDGSYCEILKKGCRGRFSCRVSVFSVMYDTESLNLAGQAGLCYGNNPRSPQNSKVNNHNYLLL